MNTQNRLMALIILLAFCMGLSPQVVSATERQISTASKVRAMLPFFIAASDNQDTIFSDDLESGASGWTAQGFWHIANNPQNIPVLHSGSTSPDNPPNDISPDLSTLPNLDQDGNTYLPSAHSGANAFWSGVDGNGTFIDDPVSLAIQTTKNGGRSKTFHTCTLTSPTIDLSSAQYATLKFWTWWEIEGVDANAYDMMYVQVSVDGGEFNTIGQLNPVNDVNNKPEQNYSSGGSFADPVWVNPHFSLTQFVGHTVKLRFLFKTVDPLYNGFRGWLIDDISVVAQGIETPVITEVSPACVLPIQVDEIIVYIFGENFAVGADVSVGGVPVTDSSVIDSTKMQILLPALDKGTYEIEIANPDEKTGTMANAITVDDQCDDPVDQNDPDIYVSPTSIEQTDDGSLNITIQNQGDSDLIISSICDGAADQGATCECSTAAAWMSVNKTNDTVGPSEYAEVTVSFDTSGLGSGDHSGNIKITSNDPDESCVTIPVTLHVSSDECSLVECTTDESGQLNIVDTKSASDSEVTVDVEINIASKKMDALGFDIEYDADCLEYTGYAAGELTSEFTQLGCNEISTGVVRCGALDTGDGIAQFASGSIFKMTFTVISSEFDALNKAIKIDFTSLVDNVEGWLTSPGYICGGGNCSCDVNENGEVTPLDALCAFQKYLEINPTSCGNTEDVCCDIDKNGDCTPADALEAFKEYLALESICSQI